MQTITYILKDIQPFKLKDDIVQMMKTFDQYPFSHLPVVDAKLFYGAISREEVEMIITEKLKLNDFKHLIEHPELWEPMGRAGRKYIEEEFNIVKQAAQLEVVYDSLL